MNMSKSNVLKMERKMMTLQEGIERVLSVGGKFLIIGNTVRTIISSLLQKIMSGWKI